VILFLGSNFLLHFSEKNSTGRPYRIEAERIAKIIEKKGVSAVDLKNYSYILHLEEYTEKNKSTFFHSDYDYLILPVRSGLYRFDYSCTEESHSRNAVFYAVFFIFFSFVFSLLLFLRNHLIKPFEEISEIPYALARGNLTIPLK
ncbi:MAG: hypothetical protein IJ733_06015, partial [Lachnospiraceae bacterium]|nr:hypothetical protein [Lachnospiraceae bacterium]